MSPTTNHKVLWPLIGAIIFFSSLFILNGKYEPLPTLVFSGVTAYFSFWAYRFSHEKFRLDLFEKRWAIYEQTLEFCSYVNRHGSLVPNDQNREELANALKAAQNSFRGIGLHKARALFGNDVNDELNKLNAHYSWLLSFPNPISDSDQSQLVQEKWERLINIGETANELPIIFQKYIYFGDFKSLD